MKTQIYLGCHVGLTSPDYYLGSVKEALSYGANTFMFYTGAPQNSVRKPLEDLKIDEGRAFIKQAGIDESKIVVHAPYIINGANPLREDIRDLAKKLIRNEIERTEGFHASILVLHPGAHVGEGASEGVRCLIECLDEVFDNNDSKVKVALETMAGKGSEIGRTFEEISQIIEGCKHQDRLGVCLDTCHIHDAGYEVGRFDEVLAEFDRIIGLDRLLALHINDSKNPKGAHKDRHENIGYGEIGFEALSAVVHHPSLAGIPMILETPYYLDQPPYKKEIEMLLADRFDDWR